ncbi:helix-turn-helix domain-containing protein [Aquibacillus rhizosphaerae]|uniref:Helix-turn-helix domain-containing protein n=1 Tax=Aquibacillus rhizosphaerae TaxID=3051431 RepID=A0ABT7L4H0_9BACI|nr:helix-turn-helix domain-containing protein [Aquibacillus sp. LR5S19]MDL4840767.1 helix-turn-helix domain-containing protein [Aquibacillus sp. LR5S19]
MFSLIILECMIKLRAERSVTSIYHLIIGKRSSQTLQDVYLYKLTSYFGILKSLNRKEFDTHIEELVTEGLFSIDNDGLATISSKGRSYYERNQEDFQLKDFNGLNYDRISENFQLRMQLLIQTITNRKLNNSTFIAITDNKQVQQWVKQTYFIHRNQLEHLLSGLYNELLLFLNGLTDKEASLFVHRLTGYEKIGLSKNQLAIKYDMTKTDVELNLVLINHKLLNDLLQDNSTYNYLSIFLKGLNDTYFITDTAAQTYQLLIRGYSIDQISKNRRLKVSTIEDHVVEIAYIDDKFSIRPFLSEHEEKEIVVAVETVNSKRLKKIKTSLNDKYSYFQIRLVLAINR